jgi:hypothetical protein
MCLLTHLKTHFLVILVPPNSLSPGWNPIPGSKSSRMAGRRPNLLPSGELRLHLKHLMVAEGVDVDVTLAEAVVPLVIPLHLLHLEMSIMVVEAEAEMLVEAEVVMEAEAEVLLSQSCTSSRYRASVLLNLRRFPK